MLDPLYLVSTVPSRSISVIKFSRFFAPGDPQHGQDVAHRDDPESATLVLESVAAQRRVAPDEVRRRQDDGQGSRN